VLARVPTPAQGPYSWAAMSTRWSVAPLEACLAGLLVAAGIALAAVEPSGVTAGFAAGGGAFAVLWVVVGLFVARRVPGNPVGPLLTAVGLAVAFTATREVGWRVLAARPHAAARLDWLVALLEESSVWLFVALALLLAYFPDGLLPGPRWRPVPWVLVVAAAIYQAWGAFEQTPFRSPLQELPRPFGPPPVAFDLLGVVAEVTLLGLFLGCAGSLVVRFRRSDEVQRRQLKVLALIGIAVPGFIVVCGSELILLGHPGWASVVVGVAALAGLPIAIAVGMLRHDLYDVDRALSTTIAYVLATGLLLTIFAVASLVTGLAMGRGSTVVAAAATAVAALALAPLRRRLQRRVDRRLYPLRQAALAAIEELQRDIHVGAAEPEQLVDRLRAALRDPQLRVGYRTRDGAGLVDERGQSLDAAGSVPVVTGRTAIGALLPGSSSTSPELLRQVAAASATLVELVRLRLELTAALREVEASRARLVLAGDEERGRLGRDLHDGAQQRLISLGMTLRLAQRHLADGGTDVDGLIDQTVAELGTAVAELREIAHGLRPSSLDDGLQAALVALTRHVPIQVVLRVPPEPLPDPVATTTFYVVSEAIANVIKHAEATRIDVAVERRNGHVEVRIVDDGKGGATVGAGSGLAGLCDRVHAVGGILALESERGAGTTIEAVVPCAS
jgi:signal transduction histidine kinase